MLARVDRRLESGSACSEAAVVLPAAAVPAAASRGVTKAEDDAVDEGREGDASLERVVVGVADGEESGEKAGRGVGSTVLAVEPSAVAAAEEGGVVEETA